MARTFLFVISGYDQQGITRQVLRSLPPDDHVIDVQQILSEGMLTLHVVVKSNQTKESLQQLLASNLAHFDITVSIHESFVANSEKPSDQLVVTLMSPRLTVDQLSLVSETILSMGCNIDSIERIAKYPVTALEMKVSQGDVEALRLQLAQIAIRNHLDLAVQRGTLQRRGKHLIVLDVDSTLIQEEVIDLLGAQIGVHKEISAITERAMAGEIDFETALRQRVNLLAGTPLEALTTLRQLVTLSPGAKTLFRVLKYLDYNIALVSGGFDVVVSQLATELGADGFVANRLEVKDGALTGNIQGQVIDRKAKADALIQFAESFDIPLERTVAVGDGANDIDMIASAGLGIAFNAKAVLQSIADTSVNVPYLDSVLYLLGITRMEVEQLNRELGAKSYPETHTEPQLHQ